MEPLDHVSSGKAMKCEVNYLNELHIFPQEQSVFYATGVSVIAVH